MTRRGCSIVAAGALAALVGVAALLPLKASAQGQGRNLVSSSLKEKR